MHHDRCERSRGPLATTRRDDAAEPSSVSQAALDISVASPPVIIALMMASSIAASVPQARGCACSTRPSQQRSSSFRQQQLAAASCRAPRRQLRRAAVASADVTGEVRAVQVGDRICLALVCNHIGIGGGLRMFPSRRRRHRRRPPPAATAAADHR